MRHSNTSQSWERFENIVEVHNCPNMTILNSIFGPCLFVYSHFHLLAYLSFLDELENKEKNAEVFHLVEQGRAKSLTVDVYIPSCPLTD